MAFAAVKLTASEGPILISSYLLAHNESNSFNALIFFSYCDLLLKPEIWLKICLLCLCTREPGSPCKMYSCSLRAFETDLETGMCYASCN